MLNTSCAAFETVIAVLVCAMELLLALVAAPASTVKLTVPVPVQDDRVTVREVMPEPVMPEVQLAVLVVLSVTDGNVNAVLIPAVTGKVTPADPEFTVLAEGVPMETNAVLLFTETVPLVCALDWPPIRVCAAPLGAVKPTVPIPTHKESVTVLLEVPVPDTLAVQLALPVVLRVTDGRLNESLSEAETVKVTFVELEVTEVVEGEPITTLGSELSRVKGALACGEEFPELD